MRVAIVADDLTGAMDASSPFADAGLRCRVLLGPNIACQASCTDEAVLAIDTDSRDQLPHLAAAAVRKALSGIDLQSTLLFKKIDSTLRGNLASELGAALGASKRTLAIVAPAAPVHGRTLRGGQLFVDGKVDGQMPLAVRLQTELPHVTVLTAASARQLKVHPGPTVVVVDAQTDDELDSIAAFGLTHQDKVLFSGSSGLAAALARAVRPGMQSGVALPRYDSVWFLVGSYNARSARQVEVLLDREPQLPKLVLAPTRSHPCLDSAWLAPVGLVHVHGLGTPPRLDPNWVTGKMGEVAAALVAGAPCEIALFLTGGDTARSVLARLAVTDIEIIGSERAGVVHGRVRLDARSVGIVTKAGGFGEPTLLADLALELSSKSRSASEPQQFRDGDESLVIAAPVHDHR
jgi:D-threonate/D-erythronate kinase